MRISQTWDELMKNVDMAYPRRKELEAMPLFENLPDL